MLLPLLLYGGIEFQLWQLVVALLRLNNWRFYMFFSLFCSSLFRSSQMSLFFLHPFIQSFVLDGNSLLSAGFVVGVMTLVVTFFLVKLHCWCLGIYKGTKALVFIFAFYYIEILYAYLWILTIKTEVNLTYFTSFG